MTIKKLIPGKIKKELRHFKRLYRLQKTRRNHKYALQRIRKKDRIKVAFFLVNESIWKYEKLYFLLQGDDRFETVVFICPFKTYGQEIMEKEMEKTYEHFSSKGYKADKVIKLNGELLDVKQEFQPDFVFFCTPWLHSFREFSIYNFLDTLTCFVNYGYTCANLYHMQYNSDMALYTWSYFIESHKHMKLAKGHSYIKGRNMIVTGFPGTDNFLDLNYKTTVVWKRQSTRKKRVIWAPHHTISGTSKSLEYSTFLTYADFFLHIAKTYQDEIQWAFKPHPNLRGKLNQIWGTEETNRYYETWEKLPYTQIEEGQYIDLFLTSDAMIHDSGSFLIEYFFVHKPVLYLINSDKSKRQYNEIGKEALSNIPLGYNKNDIIQFIKKTVLLDADDYKEKRELFFNKYLVPPNNKLASMNIYEYLLEELKQN